MVYEAEGTTYINNLLTYTRMKSEKCGLPAVHPAPHLLTTNLNSNDVFKLATSPESAFVKDGDRPQ